MGLTLLAFLGCDGHSPDNGDFTGRPDGQLIGGQTPTENEVGRRSVVLILGPAKTKRSTDFSICTGVLIDENIVLTAAHCAESFSENASQFHNRSDSDWGLVSFASAPGESRRVVRFVQHEKYRGETWIQRKKGIFSPRTPYDVALLMFEGNRPAGTEVAQIQSVEVSEIVKRPLQIYGYGLNGTGVDAETQQEKRMTGGREKFAAQAFLQTLRKKSTFSSTFEYGLLLDQRNQPGICYGDSGGPAFIQYGGKTLLVAINSHRTGTYKDLEGQKPIQNVDHVCQYYAVLNRITYFQNWIKQNVAVLKSPACDSLPFFRERAATLLNLDADRVRFAPADAGSRIVRGYSLETNKPAAYAVRVNEGCRIPSSQGLLHLTNELRSPVLKKVADQFSGSNFKTVALQSRVGLKSPQKGDVEAMLDLETKTLADESLTLMKAFVSADGKLQTETNGLDYFDAFSMTDPSLRETIKEVTTNLGKRLTVLEYSSPEEEGFRQEFWIQDSSTNETLILRHANDLNPG